MKTNLKKLQDNYYNATIVNISHANESMKSAQGWLLTLAVAELAFSGTLILESEFRAARILYGSSIIFLLFSFFTFFVGCYFQSKHLLKISREYHKLTNNVLEFIKSQNIEEIEQLPSFLSDKDIDKIKSSSTANRYFLFSSSAIAISTVILLITIIIYNI